MQSPLKSVSSPLLSEIFSAGLAVDISARAAPLGFRLFVDARLRLGTVSQRIISLTKVPGRIRIGRQNLPLPRESRSTLMQLGAWPHSFDLQRGFIFEEAEVPEVLAYLRSRIRSGRTVGADEITVDGRAMEYVHEVKEVGRNLEITTCLKHPKLELTVTKEEQVRFLEGSAYVHVGGGFYGKPKPPAFKALKAQVGTVQLSGDRIPLFLLHDLKRIRTKSKNQIAPEVRAVKVVTDPFEPRVFLSLEEPWIWLDLTYRAGSFVLPFQRIEQAAGNEQFIRGGETWVRVDSKAHERLANCISQIPEMERVQEHFRAPARYLLEMHALFSDVAVVNLSEDCIRYARQFLRAAAR
jgi:hypothetical protein